MNKIEMLILRVQPLGRVASTDDDILFKALLQSQSLSTEMYRQIDRDSKTISDSLGLKILGKQPQILS